MHIWSYDFKSENARALADKLDVRIIRHENSTFRGDPNRVVLNWGSSDLPREVRYCKVINNENSVRVAVNKIETLKCFYYAQIPSVKWTQSVEWARAWAALGHRIVCRQKVEGKDGEGLFIADKAQDIVDAKLYTIFEPNTVEFRVTVFRDKICTVQKKVRIPGLPAYNDEVRTTAGGYGFEVVPINSISEHERNAAVEAVKILELDFGGVDLITRGLGDCMVLEVNTAPVLTPHCCDKLSQAIKEAYPNG